MKVIKMIAVATMLFAAKPAFALVDVSALGGFTTFNMGALNDNIDTLANQIKTFATLQEDQRATGGYYVGTQALFNVIPGLKVGPRVEYLGATTSRLKINSTDEIRFDEAMLLTEVGAATDFSVSDKLSLQLGLWLGYGFANGNIGESFAGMTPNDDHLTGGDVAGELNVSLKYQITHMISAGLDLGWRVANVRHMFYAADNNSSIFGPVKAGDALRDFSYTDKDLVYDFGGKSIGLNVAFSF